MYAQFRSANRFVFFAALVCATLFLPATAYAGNGKFRDGKFDFCVSVRFNANATQLQRIRDIFDSANNILHDATDGVHHFGTITIVNNSGASEAADFWINSGGGVAYATLGQYGVWGQHIMMFYDDDFGDGALNSLGTGLAYRVAHEFAHHAYGVADEYSGPGFLNIFQTTAECAPPGTADATLTYCLMDNFFERGLAKTSGHVSYSLNEFCSEGNHDDAAAGNPGSANNTYQQYINGMSCWEWISTHPKWAIPAKNPPSDTEGFPLTVPTHQSGSPDRRFMLLLDRSGSMALDSKITFARAAGNAFLLDVPDNTQVGIASFADSGRLDFFLTPITESNRQQAINTLFNIFPDGNTNIGHGLQIALAELEAQTDACCTQAIVLISDGDHNVGTPPSAVIDSLVEAGVAVFTLGVGSGLSASGEFTLQDLAKQTGGKYYRVASAFNLGPAIESILFSEAIGSGPSRRTPLAVTTGQVTEVSVPVEQGAARAAFVMDKANSGDSITLSLRTPSGQIINPSDGSGGNPNIRFRTAAFTQRFYITSPQAGTWTMIITANSVTNGNINVAGLMEHEGTKLSAFVKNEFANYPEPFKLTAALTWEGARVVGATVTGTVIHPQGASVPITLYDDGRLEHGDDIPGDGVYSQSFNYVQKFGSQYRTGLPIAGSYTIELTGVNTSGNKYEGEVALYPGVTPTQIPAPAFTRLVSTTAIVANVPADPRAVVFRSDRSGNYEIYSMSESGSNVTRLTTSTTNNYKPAYSPNGQKLAFVAEQDGSNWWDIIVTNADGTNRVNLTHDLKFSLQFSWSPDSKKIIFESDRDGPFALWMVNADGTGMTKLLNNAGPEQPPSWSPNGRKVAYLNYINSVNNKTDVWIMNPDGSNQINLTQSDAQESFPTWSPDGTKILFARRFNSSSQYDLYVINPDGTGLQRLTTSGGAAPFDWSPDGTKIAFTTTRNGNSEVYVMNADGTNQTNLTNNSGSDFGPAWSLDGLRMLFGSWRTSNYEVFIMNPDGTSQINLTNNAAVDDWYRVLFRP